VTESARSPGLRRLGIHPLALADIVNVPQRPKAELYDDRLLVVLRMTRLAGGAPSSRKRKGACAARRRWRAGRRPVLDLLLVIGGLVLLLTSP